jgi:hypothetical protein
MLSGLVFVLALYAVLRVLFWSIKVDNTTGIPRSGVFGVRAAQEVVETTPRRQLLSKQDIGQ